MANWKVIALVSGNIEAVSGPAAQDRPGTHEWMSGKGKPLTKLKPSKVQRKPIPGLTWSGCAFATRGILMCGRISVQPLQSLASLATGDACRIQPVDGCAPGQSTISAALSDHFGGHRATSLAPLINSMKSPWSLVRAAAESCGSTASSEPWAMS
jgi:hypothetical protein